MQTSPMLVTQPAWVEAVLEMFPVCAACGKAIEAGEAAVQAGDRNRLRHSKECGVIA